MPIFFTDLFYRIAHCKAVLLHSQLCVHSEEFLRQHTCNTRAAFSLQAKFRTSVDIEKYDRANWHNRTSLAFFLIAALSFLFRHSRNTSRHIRIGISLIFSMYHARCNCLLILELRRVLLPCNLQPSQLFFYRRYSIVITKVYTCLCAF